MQHTESGVAYYIGIGNIKVALGGLVGTFVGLSQSSLDTSLAMETKPIYGKTKPEGNKNGQEMSGVICMGMHLPLPVASFRGHRGASLPSPWSSFAMHLEHEVLMTHDKMKT